MSHLPLSVLLNQLSLELGALQLMAADMEATVDDMIERNAGVLDARSIQNLQLLDILNQTLLALAQFAANTAALASPGIAGTFATTIGIGIAASILSAVFGTAIAALASPGWQVDGQSAVSGLKLASLAQRLSRGAGHAVTVQDEVYELFSDG